CLRRPEAARSGAAQCLFPGGQVFPQPPARLLAPAPPLRLLQVGCVRPTTATGLGGRAGGAEAVAGSDVFRQRRRGGGGGGVSAGGWGGGGGGVGLEKGHPRGRATVAYLPGGSSAPARNAGRFGRIRASASRRSTW